MKLTLEKAIAEYTRLHEVISREQQRANRAEQLLETLRHDNDSLRRENAQYRAENSQLANANFNRSDSVHLANAPQFNMGPQHHPVQPIQSPTAISGYTTDRYSGPPAQHLPPLRLNGNTESMNGIQYHDAARVNAPQRY